MTKQPPGEYLGKFYLFSAKPKPIPDGFDECVFRTKDGKNGLELGGVKRPEELDYVEAWLDKAAQVMFVRFVALDGKVEWSKIVGE